MDEQVLEIIEKLPGSTSYYTAALFPLIAYFVKIAIDNYESTELERLLMSNFKKFQIALSKYFFIGLAFIAIFNLILKNQNIISIKNSEVFYVVWLACFIITIAIIFLLEIFINFIFSLFNIKYDYYIVNENNEDAYRVIKLSGKHILAESEGIYMFIDNFKQRRYRKVAVSNAFLESIYTYRYLNQILWAMIIFDLISLIFVFFSSGIMQAIFYIVFVILLLVFLVILTNSRIFTRENLSSTNIIETEDPLIDSEQR
ncbi:hypothetical protein [Sporosarcina koreensis]|uniref:hypothetical protein n=1 Tax=Sporosarcina koreensis TaxID=334735 RepID=UPI0007568997|nr:hypothetical protein [Sporosarcina koreensis]